MLSLRGGVDRRYHVSSSWESTGPVATNLDGVFQERSHVTLGGAYGACNVAATSAPGKTQHAAATRRNSTGMADFLVTLEN